MTSTEYHLPALPLNQATAEIVRWLKRPGDRLTPGEPLLLVLGERAEVLLPAPAAGVLDHLLAAAGAAVRPGDALASITMRGPAQAAPTPTEPAGPPRRASPLARRLASALGVDLADVAGSGPGGVIRKADVLAADALSRNAPAAGDERLAAEDPRAAALQLGAEIGNFALAAGSATHGLAVMRADFSQVRAACHEHAAAFARRGLPLDPLLCVAAVVVEALLRHPLLNSRWQADCIRLPKRISLALSRPGGVRLIENAHDLSLRGLARAYSHAEAPAPGAYTFLLAEAPADQWLRQLAPTQSAALAIGALHAQPVPVRENGAERIAVRQIALLALSYDARLIDQRQADTFLSEVVARLARFPADVAGV